MQKYALRMSVGSVVLAAFGGFLRWMQNQVSFEKDTGLAVRGSIWPYMLALWVLVGAVYLAVIVVRMQRSGRVRLPRTFASAFRPDTVLTPALSLVFGLMMLVGGLLLVLRTPLYEPQRKLLMVLGAIAALTGLSFPIYLLRAGEEDPPSALRPALGALPIALFAFWLIVSYKMHIVNPTISSYAPEMGGVFVSSRSGGQPLSRRAADADRRGGHAAAAGVAGLHARGEKLNGNAKTPSRIGKAFLLYCWMRPALTCLPEALLILRG